MWTSQLNDDLPNKSVLIDAASGAPRARNAERRLRGYVAGALLVIGLSVAVVSVDTWLPSLQSVVLKAGQAYIAASQAVQSRTDSEYLVVLRGEESRDAVLAFIAANPRMNYAGGSTYRRAVRVMLKGPVAEAQKDLEAQPYVEFVMPVLPGLFCH